MKKFYIGLNIFCAVFIAFLICVLIRDITKARKLENVASGGYESLLEYESRDDFSPFVSKEAYVAEKSYHYKMEAKVLSRKVRAELLCCLPFIVGSCLACILIKKEKKEGNTNSD